MKKLLLLSLAISTATMAQLGDDLQTNLQQTKNIKLAEIANDCQKNNISSGSCDLLKTTFTQFEDNPVKKLLSSVLGLPEKIACKVSESWASSDDLPQDCSSELEAAQNKLETAEQLTKTAIKDVMNEYEFPTRDSVSSVLDQKINPITGKMSEIEGIVNAQGADLEKIKSHIASLLPQKQVIEGDLDKKEELMKANMNPQELKQGEGNTFLNQNQGGFFSNINDTLASWHFGKDADDSLAYLNARNALGLAALAAAYYYNLPGKMYRMAFGGDTPKEKELSDTVSERSYGAEIQADQSYGSEDEDENRTQQNQRLNAEQTVKKTVKPVSKQPMMYGAPVLFY